MIASYFKIKFMFIPTFRFFIFLILIIIPLFNFSQAKDTIPGISEVITDTVGSSSKETNSSFSSDCLSCLSWKKTSINESICFPLYLILTFVFSWIILKIAKKCRKQREIIIALGIGIVINFFTVLIQSKIYYFSMNTMQQLENQEAILKRTDTLLLNIRDLLRTTNEHTVILKEVAEGIKMESHSGIDYTLSENLKQDTILGVDIDILETDYRWKCKSTDTISHRTDGKQIPVNKIIADYIKSQITDVDTNGIICIGNASSEGRDSLEEQRSEERMYKLCSIFRSMLPNNIPVYGFNLGKFLEDSKTVGCSITRADQRRIVILKITYKKPGLNHEQLSESVKKILLWKATIPMFPINIQKYSKYANGQLYLDASCIKKLPY